MKARWKEYLEMREGSKRCIMFNSSNGKSHLCCCPNFHKQKWNSKMLHEVSRVLIIADKSSISSGENTLEQCLFHLHLKQDCSVLCECDQAVKE